MKILTASEVPAGEMKFDFSGASTLIIHSCAPVKDEPESGFWRRLKQVEVES